ncbi:MAG: CoA pyrophosphatase [Flavobacteriaceae bacterium]|nr:MAG: CoA pyrophosphatase [Flavobacteriaceae bacterium]
MDFDYFLSLNSRIEEMRLGGLESQFKMIPKERKMMNIESIKRANPKKAAVLALFYPDRSNLTNFLLILRASYDGTHADQIGFPGGKFEEADQDLKITALRETSEEVGIPMEEIKMLRKITDTYIPPSNFIVSPYLGVAKNRPLFKMNHEVEEIIEVPLKDLLNDKSVSMENLTTSYMKNIDVPCFHLNNRIVWGATAMMLSEIKDLIRESLL